MHWHLPFDPDSNPSKYLPHHESSGFREFAHRQAEVGSTPLTAAKSGPEARLAPKWSGREDRFNQREVGAAKYQKPAPFNACPLIDFRRELGPYEPEAGGRSSERVGSKIDRTAYRSPGIRVRWALLHPDARSTGLVLGVECDGSACHHHGRQHSGNPCLLLAYRRRRASHLQR